MTTPDETAPQFDGDPVAELEAFIAQTEARGEPVPQEARVMLERLRELMSALRGLSASFDRAPEPPPASEADGEKPGGS